ncbi:MAG: hypothetical protein ACSHX6_11745 [Akkermansiaceae bacterium]
MPKETENKRDIKVAAVIDDLTIIINCGAADAIAVGDRFLIYSLGEEITDPDTGDSLGRLEVIKGTGKSVHVQLKMATISSDMKSVASRTIRKNTTHSALRTLGMLGGHNVEEEILPSEKVPFEDVVVGDMIRKIRD